MFKSPDCTKMLDALIVLKKLAVPVAPKKAPSARLSQPMTW
jgi:hypothetical protein